MTITGRAGILRLFKEFLKHPPPPSQSHSYTNPHTHTPSVVSLQCDHWLVCLSLCLSPRYTNKLNWPTQRPTDRNTHTLHSIPNTHEHWHTPLIIVSWCFATGQSWIQSHCTVLHLVSCSHLSRFTCAASHFAFTWTSHIIFFLKENLIMGLTDAVLWPWWLFHTGQAKRKNACLLENTIKTTGRS